MNETQKIKIQRFLSDEILVGAVYEILNRSFLKRREGEDVEMKAARFIATELLTEGWRELEKFKSSEGGEQINKLVQVGL